ncbi:MAG: hypothetical protein JKY28_02505 [Sulfurimonas sp.]|nr:hypothetical protein [Sulfurimonas sp.]
MIDVEVKSEEMYIRMSVAYEGHEEKEQVHSCVDTIVAKHKCQAEQHTSQILHNREVLVTEYHDEDPREVARIFEKIMKALDIQKCI